MTQNEYVISSVLGNLKIVEIILNRIRKEATLDESRSADLRLMLGESITNAIIHGNSGKPEKQVRIQYRIEGKYLWCCVMDEGKGFDIGGLKDPTANENIEQQGGRGVYIIQKLSEACDYSKGDSAFHFTMKLS